MNRHSYTKDVYCHNCDEWFNYLGIPRHRAMHRDRKEKVKITYTNGDTKLHDFTEED
jgi:hypothetical protein